MEKFDLLYESFFKRITIEKLEDERSAQVRAVLSNSAFNEAENAEQVIHDIVEGINADFDATLREIIDPGYEDRAQEELLKTPLYAVGLRSFEDMKFRLEAAG